MAFIEAQLKHTFVDPDDPRLAERVHRLEGAFRLLTLPERRRLSDELRDPAGNQLSRNFQKLATPSRNRLMAALSRGMAAAVEGKTLGTLSFAGAATAFGIPLAAQIEIVPSTDEAGTFAGYTDVGSARAVALRRATIAAIVFDTRLERYRVFETGVPINRQLAGTSVAARESTGDYRVAEWVNLEGPQIPTWPEREKRMQAAVALRLAFEKKYASRPLSTGAADKERERDLKELQDAYQVLLEEVAPFVRGQLHAMVELAVPDPSGKFIATTANTAMINVNPFRGDVHGYTTVLDPMADVATVPGGYTRRSIPSMIADAPPVPYEPYSVLSPAALGKEPLFTTGVIQHELTHREHMQRTIDLYEQWKSETSPMSFQTWIETRVKARALSAAEGALVIEQSHSSKFLLPNTETLAEVEQFTSVYHAAPLGDFGLDELPQMASRWIGADASVQELAVRKLAYYYQRMLGPAYRQAFDQKVVDLLVQAHANSDARQAFYVRLAEFGATQ